MNLCDIKTIKQLMAMFSLNFRKEFEKVLEDKIKKHSLHSNPMK